ncbi:HTH domain-containing protein [Erysipelothrix urinaevulpis]|uniref:HTH domain-containing protein n=1 Tax=Erysipelothrix urinaevulpis TaxID=2683717 RepID=UPI00135BF536|nr:HTH domain-containing protein [Erysipelothrix urinaevulpis]
MKNDIALFNEKNDYLSEIFKEVNYRDFYRDLFPIGSFERKGIYEDKKGNGIAIAMNADRHSRYTVTDELSEIDDLIDNDFVVMNGISYFGKQRIMKNANFMYALIFDIDGISDMGNLKTLIHHFNSDITPKPTYLVNSGHGVHLYFVFKEPIPLYNHLKEPLKRLKYDLTRKIWNPYVSNIKEVQYQGLNQGFRMVGSPTKFGKKYRLKAYKTGDKVELDYLNKFVFEKENRVLETNYQSELTLEQAKEKYPDWYERKIVNQENNSEWTVNRALYDWWIEKIKEGATYGHRYFCVMALSIYAVKCDIPFEELEKDAYSLIPDLNNIRPDEPFTKHDVDSALKAYDPSYKNFPRADIEKITSISIPENKRNYRTQVQHLQIARATRDIVNPNWREGNGRPSKEKLVKDFIKENPDLSVTEIARELNVSRPTVYKYLKK